MFLFIILAGLFYSISSAGVLKTQQPENNNQSGSLLLAQGNFEQAILQLENDLNRFQNKGNLQSTADLLINLSSCYRAIGHLQPAFKALVQAQAILEKLNDKAGLARVYGLLCEFYLQTGDIDTAQQVINTARQAMLHTDRPEILASMINSSGNINMATRSYDQAVQAYEKCIVLSGQSNLTALKAKAMVNRTHAYFMAGNGVQAVSSLDSALRFILTLPDSYSKAKRLVSIGILAFQMKETMEPHGDHLIEQAASALSRATQLSGQYRDVRLTSMAYGYLGKLYEAQKSYDDAMHLTQVAIFYAQQQDARDILYRWQWQKGRLFRKMGQYEQAISDYRHAVRNLQSIRYTASFGVQSGPISFQNSVRPVYYELTELLIDKAESTIASEDRFQILEEARNTVEQFKTAEMKDYFQDECVTELQSKATGLEGILNHAAVIYPISFARRLVILVSLPQGFEIFNVPVDADTLSQTVDKFRFQLQNRISHQYIKNSQQLYSWLILPLKKVLDDQKIDTLIIVPDGKLRTIPFSALHNGEKFLIDRYAICVVPGITLTEPNALGQTDFKLLISGLSKGVQGFSPLPNVPDEIDSIKDIGISKIFLDQDFSMEAIEKEMKIIPYSVVHIASHGQFKSDPNQTFLLMFDKKLRMNQLSRIIRITRFREKPVELLTLSACQTAVGDDRAALGLAGVAMKAGARSALATLWFINDNAASKLITQFYKGLMDPTLNKAKALQNAQKMLLKERKFRHPIYWAPYLLIGNWL